MKSFSRAHQKSAFEIETVLGGCVRAGVHEIFTPETAHLGAATGFIAALASIASDKRMIVWVRQDFLNTETGRLDALGLAELGIDPDRFILVYTRDAEGVLRAGERAARCAAIGSLVIESWGEPKIINFTSSRRLSLAAAKSKVPVFMMRAAAAPSLSAAATRWMVRSAPSLALVANAPGYPAFEVKLLRHRGGMAEAHWCLEWNRDGLYFQERKNGEGAATVPRTMVSFSHHRPSSSEAPHHAWLRAQ